TDMELSAQPLPAGEIGNGEVVRVSWKYLNGYGSVPERDDVRFNVAIREIPIPPRHRPAEAGDYPTIAEAQGEKFEHVNGDVGVSGSAKLIANASYAGHQRWTDPVASAIPRDYRIDFPAKCNRRYLVRILPKRFCFDQSAVAYSSVDHLLYADVRC